MARPTSIPTEADWEGGRGLRPHEVESAKEEFFGKSTEECLPHFSFSGISPSFRAAELMEVSGKVFAYYVFAMADFVMLDATLEKPDVAPFAAVCFLELIRNQLKEQPGHVLPVLDDLLPALRYAAENQESFSADPEIFGSFPEIYAEILQLSGRSS
jgi:hypothetical protein